MAGFPVLLNSRGRKSARRRRADLLSFFEALSLHLHGGFDLSFAWPRTLGGLREALGEESTKILEVEEGGTLGGKLKGLFEDYPTLPHRVWFGTLAELYEQGAGMGEAVVAVSNALRLEQQRDFETHCRTLPTKTNLYLLVFFLPPTLFLLFAPLLVELGRQFS